MAEVSSSSGQTAKLTFTPMLGKKTLTPDRLNSFEVLFNPNSYSVSKNVVWTPSTSAKSNRSLNAPPISFGGGGGRTLSLNLFFDVTEPVRIGDDEVMFEDVREATSKLVAFTRIDRTVMRPLALEVSWGNKPDVKSDLPFLGVISSLNQNFTMFSEDGRPLRAEVSVSLLEFIEVGKDKRDTDPELTTRQVQRGDRLSSIAAEHYGDPAQWRLIAEANDIDDARRAPIGARLSVPKV